MNERTPNAVRHAKSQYGIDLDYSEASLQQIDRMLDGRLRGTVMSRRKVE